MYQLVSDFPHLSFSLNGGVKSLAEAAEHLQNGVSIPGFDSRVVVFFLFLPLVRGGIEVQLHEFLISGDHTRL